MITPHPTDTVWRTLLRDILEYGDEVSPMSAGADWRGRTSSEIIGHRTAIPMANPVIRSAARRLGHRFLVAEAAWIAEGDNRVATIAPYAPHIRKFSDDGVRFFGAYGPRFIDQLSYATKCLRGDPGSRQAVIQVWREQPRSTNDVPCTLSWQWMIRAGKLHCVATMRSSDAWTGWVYDVFNFSVLSAVVALELRAWANLDVKDAATGEPTRPYADLELGNLHFTAGSQHLYRVDHESARAVLAEPDPLPAIAPLNLGDFRDGAGLIAHLWGLARGSVYIGERASPWLGELFP